MAPRDKPAFVVVRCRNCKKYFTSLTRQHMWCQECRLKPKQTTIRRRPSGMKQVMLICGHTSGLPQTPVVGEELWCIRCDGWVEYNPIGTQPYCENYRHRMTAFNTASHPEHPKQRVCRKCWYNRTGVFL